MTIARPSADSVKRAFLLAKVLDAAFPTRNFDIPEIYEIDELRDFAQLPEAETSDFCRFDEADCKQLVGQIYQLVDGRLDHILAVFATVMENVADPDKDHVAYRPEIETALDGKSLPINEIYPLS